jgi:choline-sulfatase
VPDTRPNIVLILSDQHNPHVIGYAGDPVVRTPNLDALAAQGTRFDNLYCAYPLCVPARMSFMTGQYPSAIGSWDNRAMLASDVPTFAHTLRDAGYDTALCGRMHFVGPDQLHGFETRIHDDCWGWLTPEIEGRGDQRTTGQRRYAVETSGYGRTGYEAFDDSVTATACDFIRARTDSNRPYCLVVGMMLPHNPLICERQLFDHYMDALGPYEPPTAAELDRLHPAVRRWRERREADRIDPLLARRARAAYYGLVTTLDRNVGRVTTAVQDGGDADNTVLIYTSDHGDMAGEQGLWWKSNFYDGAARVPTVVSWPGHFPAGCGVRNVASLVDIAPTLAELAGAAPLPAAAGRSLLPFLQGRPPADWPDAAFSEYAGLQGDHPGCMIRSGPWKLNYYSEFDSWQLFNLDADPWERDDRRDDPAVADVAARLVARIHDQWSADVMRRGAAELRARGGASVPARAAPPPGVNAFAFSQLPRHDCI